MTKHTITVSVVMPCYKVEKYLPKCIESVLASTLSNMEIILVDDGSPDKCGQIIDNYAKKDKRIVPIHKKNGGYGSAVNAGIKKARGEYIGIVETDDWISPDMYEILYNTAKKTNADCVKGNFYHCISREKEIPHLFVNTLPINTSFTLKEHPELLLLAPSIWSAIYKKSFLDKKEISLVEDIRPYEDLPFAFEVYAKAEKIVLVNQYVYFYRCEPNQGSSTVRGDRKLFNVTKQFDTTIKKLYQLGVWDFVKEGVYKHLYNTMTLFVGNANIWLKKSLYNEFHKLCCIFQCDNISYVYFNGMERKKIKYLEQNRFFKYYFFQEKKNKAVLKFLNFIPLLSIRRYKDKKKINIFGIPVLKFQYKPNKIKIYFFGVPLLCFFKD